MVFGPDTEPPLFPPPTTLDEVRPLTVQRVVRYTREGKRWNEFIARYHYLGYKTLVGAQMRYAVYDRDGGPLAMLGFLHCRLEARPARQVHRVDAATAREEHPLRGRQPEIPHPAMDQDPQPRIAHPCHHPPPPARRLDRALQHHTPCSSRPSSRPRATPAPSTGLRAGSMSEPPRAAGATTATSCSTSRARTSGSGPSEQIGNEPSIGRINLPSTARQNAYPCRKSG